ncbi:MAG TPA: serine hydrolase domain-containing protein [Gemmatimonadaceae bacterium]|nr:serine hydrolase domain-containing protein [Gemmatimonadaceae bacterium]
MRHLLSAATLLAPVALGAQQLDSATLAARADRGFAAVAATASSTTPGCAAAIAQNGRQLWARAIGMADLEFGIPNTPQTIFETGSVAKQFTAASVVLLALDGKLGLDEPVRKYVPELPDYGKPLTIRHLLNHTSGIRDWGSVLGLTGFGRGDRVVSQVLAMDVITHQKGIDFTPGAEYSYSNSGYTLLSTIVERVSKQSLPAFTQERLFKPLGITAQWRDDYQRLVPGRAQAYAPVAGGAAGARGARGAGGPAGSAGTWRLEMPFMNVYGNGGLLMTVGDMLKWNAMLESRALGGALVDSLERRGRLNDGREIAYALGLTVNTYRGLRQVAHSGSTAGYNAYLTRFPDLKLSVAVMCNAASVSSTGVAMRLVDSIAGPLPNPPAPDTVSLAVSELEKRVGLWRAVATHLPAQTIVENGALRLVGGAVLRPLRDGSFLAAQGPVRWRFEPGTGGQPARATRLGVEGDEPFVAESPWTPAPAELAQLTGEWHSEEAGASFTFAVEDGQPVLRQRPATRRPLRALYRDHFGPVQGGGTVIWFTRDTGGRVNAMHFGTSRLRDMPFARIGK